LQRLQDQVRVALTKFALVPVVIMALICIILAAFYWNWNVVRMSSDKREQAVQILSETFSDYEERVDAISRIDLDKLNGNDKDKQDFYVKFYKEINRRGDHPYFYLLDENRNLILANPLPRLDISRSPVHRWGALFRMEQSKETQLEFVQDNYTNQWNLLIGRALHKAGRLQGYMVFVLRGEELAGRIAFPEVHLVLQDEYGYTPLSTLGLLKNASFKQELPNLEKDTGIVTLENQALYMTRQSFWQDKFTLYSFMPIGNRSVQFATGIFILLGVLLLMIPIITFSLKRETKRKMQAVEELSAAFQAVKDGRLDYDLQIHTGNEFEEIADEYNRMVQSLKELMSLNEAEARANVVSELRQLESQFNPHFLFNTLENIKFMIKLDPDAAGKMIVALSSLLRYSINNTVRQVVLKDDLEHLASYMVIQQERFGKRLDYQDQIEPVALECLVPKLLLQPVVENAIKYGADAEGKITIRAKIYVDNDQLKVEIKDQGQGIEREQLKNLQQLLHQEGNTSVHTGIYNIHRRIQLMYGRQYGLTVECPPTGGTLVQMVLPVRKGSDN
jgi:two-component system sensor histidine kinase YesM